jgi:hypothetical protein
LPWRVPAEPKVWAATLAQIMGVERFRKQNLKGWRAQGLPKITRSGHVSPQRRHNHWQRRDQTVATMPFGENSPV